MVRLAFLFWLLTCGGAAAQTVNVFAAASLSGTLEKALAGADCGDVRPVFAGSSTLSRQILSGAPADVFVSAHDDWIAALRADGALVPDSERIIAGNSLVLVSGEPGVPVPDDASADVVLNIVGDDRISVGLVEAVPAGMYAKAALQTLGLWGELRSQLVETDSVRAALALVTRGATPHGSVYASDAAFAGLSVRFVFPPIAHAPIRYTAAVVRDGAGARCVLDHLAGEAGRAVLLSQGFMPPP